MQVLRQMEDSTIFATSCGVTNGDTIFERAIDEMVEEEGLKYTFQYLDNITVAGNWSTI